MKTTKRALALALGLITLAAPNALRADSTTTYDFTGTLQSPVNGTTSITATFTLDTTTGALVDGFQAVDGNFTWSPANSQDLTLRPPNVPAGELGVAFFSPPLNNCELNTSPGPCGFVLLSFVFTPGFASLVFDPSQSAACFIPDSDNKSCNSFYAPEFGGAIAFFSSGSAIATPEPAPLTLLGTGLVGLWPLTRRVRSA